ncbi:MAG TPA: ATP-binding protein [Steroidobacteraceae bacterium]|nr:ATP-binding protein [Steroidobacteraceae bacterium]
MPQNRTKGTPERATTDKSLTKERQNADQALAEQKAAVEADADRVVKLAREQADTVLHAARDKADVKLESVMPTPLVRAVIERERKSEDRAVENERAAADEALQQEREQNARDLLALLPLERKSTDRSLSTERVRSDDAVAHRDDVLAMVSHDLRDLLGAIVSSSALVLRTAAVGDAGNTTRTGAERIQRYAARMKRLIDDLTDVARIDAGKLSLRPAPGNLAPLINEAVLALRGAATSKDLSLDLPFCDEPIPVIFDGDRVLQVLTNLIANAIKFTPAGGRIRVECAHAEHMARVSISDTGPGIAPDLLEAIFERFRQGENQERRGLGLGLYISRTLIEAQHGKIWAESTPGNGTTVSFTLPLMREVT